MPRRKKFVEKSGPTCDQILPSLNEDVTPFICSWLPLHDVKNCRLVSRSWNISAKPILKQKSVIKLECDFNTKEIARNAKFKREMTAFGRPLHHVDIDTWNIANLDLGSEPYLDNVHFFTKYLSVQRLGISLGINSVWMPQFLEQVLLYSAHTLVELDLHIFEDSLKEGDSRAGFCGGKIFNTVKKLTLTFATLFWRIVPPRVPGVHYTSVPQILAAFPNIVELRVTGSLLPVLFVEGSPSPRFLSKLCVTNGMSGSQCNALLNLTQPLKHLYIKSASDPRDPDWEDGVDIEVSQCLYEVLSKNRHTLEYLDLLLDKLRAGCVWKFPSFPNLKRLNFMEGLGAQKYYDCEVSFDGSDILNYSETFPNLQSLSFSPWDGNWTRCFESFFPEEARVCKSVTNFEILDKVQPDNLADMFVKFAEGKIDARFGRILKLFPNVDNRFMNELRSYLVKMGHICD
ncbi:uncharacterized protein LOC118436864 [Folsomia candida]|uniref:uncharacterized protein LOC118436864 n=1 Tax=Folsomia candida TaxID=158441 RepID=UPI001604FFCD|nr:uncharacterized protein LOC118436864 [Folsomia candida]XP_035711395.1 uncharacterized protein LOC118436864 [Folsomia candida]